MMKTDLIYDKYRKYEICVPVLETIFKELHDLKII